MASNLLAMASTLTAMSSSNFFVMKNSSYEYKVVGLRAITLRTHKPSPLGEINGSSALAVRFRCKLYFPRAGTSDSMGLPRSLDGGHGATNPNHESWTVLRTLFIFTGS